MLNQAIQNRLKKAGVTLPESDFLSVWNLLPRVIEKNQNIYWLAMTKDDDGSGQYNRIAYEGLQERTLFEYDDSMQPLVDAAGNTAIHLIERGFVTVSEGQLILK